MLVSRRILPLIQQDLRKKMVMVAGPRQCGKTTLAKDLLRHTPGRYYNWDTDQDRKALLSSKLDESAGLWVLDEIHKNRRWRNWLKGSYDQHHPAHGFLVTGSARLEVYSRGGDSLQGRYFLHHLHPFTLGELVNSPLPNPIESLVTMPFSTSHSEQKILEDLVELGGFPEPFLSQSQKEASRWRLGYGSRLVREDIRELENLRDLARLELLYDRLADTVGSVLSLNSLREDLEVAFETIRSWIGVFENTYGVFRIPPFGAPKIKAVKKEQKLYFWDWAKASTEAARLENLVAVHLLRLCHWLEDVEGQKAELRYFRDKVGHEVDFILVKAKKPWLAVEVKSNERQMDSNLKYLLERVKIPYAFQISLKGKSDWATPEINGTQVRVMPAARFLAQLP